MIPEKPKRPVKPKAQKKWGGHPLGFKTLPKEVKLGAGESLHFRTGLGYYGAKKGTGQSFGTKAGPAPPTSSASQAPAAQKAAASASAAGLTKADLISQYNLERAKILQGMAPQIQDIYQQAGANIGGAVDASTKAQYDSLYNAGDAKASAFDPTIDPRIAQSYEIDKAPNAAAYLGKVLPQDTFTKQGAAFGAAAAFAPAAALQEGQYALVKAVEEAKVANADAAKVSASVSKMLGYVADAYGNPILGKNGKPVKLPDQNAMTPYQQAQLKLAGGRLDLSVANAQTNAAEAQARLDQSDAHFKDNYNFKTAKAQADYEIAVEKGLRPNAALSGRLGYLVDSHGKAILNKKGRHIPVAKTGAAKPKGKSVTDIQKIDDTIKQWYQGKPVNTGSTSGKDAEGNTVSEKNFTYTGQIGYQPALRKLMRDYKMNLKTATAKLNEYWKRGERGRPLVSLQEARWLLTQKKLVKAGITPKLLAQARSGTSVDAKNAFSIIDHILQINNISL